MAVGNGLQSEPCHVLPSLVIDRLSGSCRSMKNESTSAISYFLVCGQQKKIVPNALSRTGQPQNCGLLDQVTWRLPSGSSWFVKTDLIQQGWPYGGAWNSVTIHLQRFLHSDKVCLCSPFHYRVASFAFFNCCFNCFSSIFFRSLNYICFSCFCELANTSWFPMIWVRSPFECQSVSVRTLRV